MSFSQIIVWPFAKLLWLFNFTGSYAVALLFFAIVVKVILLPMSIKQQKTQIKGAKLRPKIAAIEKKYAGRTDRKTLEKKQQEIMKLQQDEGYSPLSGCLPLLIQFPIIIILYNIIQNPLTHVCGFSEEIITSLTSIVFPDGGTHTQLNLLAALQGTGGVGIAAEWWEKIQDINLSFFGLNMGVTPELTSIYVIIPILVALSSYASMKLTRKLMGQNPAMQAQQGPEARTSNIIMDLMMPLMSLWFAFNLPALLGLYWIYQSILGVVQQLILSKAMPLPTYTEEEIRTILKAEKERANVNRAAMRQNNYNEKSLHHIDDDDDEDVYVPEIRSKFDEDDEPTASNAPIAPAPVQKPSEQTHQRQRKKKK